MSNFCVPLSWFFCFRIRAQGGTVLKVVHTQLAETVTDDRSRFGTGGILRSTYTLLRVLFICAGINASTFNSWLPRPIPSQFSQFGLGRIARQSAAAYDCRTQTLSGFHPRTPFRNQDCSVCSDGYTKELGFVCRECSNGSAGSIALAVVLAVVALVAAAAVFSYGMGTRMGQGTVARLGRYIPLQSIKIVVVAWQILTQVSAGDVSFNALASLRCRASRSLIFFQHLQAENGITTKRIFPRGCQSWSGATNVDFYEVFYWRGHRGGGLFPRREDLVESQRKIRLSASEGQISDQEIKTCLPAHREHLILLAY